MPPLPQTAAGFLRVAEPVMPTRHDLLAAWQAYADEISRLHWHAAGVAWHGAGGLQPRAGGDTATIVRAPHPATDTLARAAAIAGRVCTVVEHLDDVVDALRVLTDQDVEPVALSAFLWLTPEPDPTRGQTVPARYVELGLIPAETTAWDLGQQLSRSVTTEIDGDLFVPWWPRVPDRLAAEFDWQRTADRPACPVDDLELPWSEPVNWFRYEDRATCALTAVADTYGMLADRRLGWEQAAASTPNGPSRKSALAQRTQYRWLTPWMRQVGDRVVADFVATLNQMIETLQLLTENSPIERVPTMPALLSTPAVVSSLASGIHDAVTAGHSGRLATDNSETAFAWAGVPTTLISHLATGTVTSRKFTAVRVKDSTDPVGPVAEGGVKPNLIQFTSEDLALAKYAGSAVMTVESAMFIANIEAALSAVMVGRLLRAIEADTSTVIIADAGVQITAAVDITAGVISATAAIAGNGGAATIVGLSSADYVAIMTAVGTGGGYVNFDSAQAGPGTTWMGLLPCLIPGLAAGTALVLDGAAVTVNEVAGAPLVIVDVFTGASKNETSVYLETWAKSYVTTPGHVAHVTVGP